MELNEPIRIQPYDPCWPELAAEEIDRLSTALGRSIAIEHFGSTAVPGLAAKPIVDLLVGFDSYPPPADSIAELQAIGYQCLGEAGVPGRIYCRKRQPPAINLALVDRHGPLWRDNLLLRDFLRAHPAEAARYAAHKQANFERGATDLLTYSEAKHALVQELRQAAHTWADSHGSAPNPALQRMRGRATSHASDGGAAPHP